MKNIVLGEGGSQASIKTKVHIQSSSKKRAKDAAKYGKQIYKKHAEKMKQLKSGRFRKEVNPGFFSNTKGEMGNLKTEYQNFVHHNTMIMLLLFL